MLKIKILCLLASLLLVTGCATSGNIDAGKNALYTIEQIQAMTIDQLKQMNTAVADLQQQHEQDKATLKEIQAELETTKQQQDAQKQSLDETLAAIRSLSDSQNNAMNSITGALGTNAGLLDILNAMDQLTKQWAAYDAQLEQRIVELQTEIDRLGGGQQ